MTKLPYFIAPTKKSEERFRVCEACEYFNEQYLLCEKCKCFMPLKARIDSAKCPLGKW